MDARLIGEFADLHRRIVVALRNKQYRDAELPSPFDRPPADAFVDIIGRAMRLDQELFATANELDPLPGGDGHVDRKARDGRDPSPS
jgi:hypothetical protein